MQPNEPGQEKPPLNDEERYGTDGPREPGAAQPAASTPATDETLRAMGDVYQQGVRVAHDAQALFSLLDGALQSARGMVREQLDVRPYATLGAAAGAGYVLGGGLASSLTRMALKAGSRMLVTYVVKEALEGNLPDLMQPGADKGQGRHDEEEPRVPRERS